MKIDMIEPTEYQKPSATDLRLADERVRNRAAEARHERVNGTAVYWAMIDGAISRARKPELVKWPKLRVVGK